MNKKTGESTSDKVTFFILDWILKPIAFIFGFYLLGAIFLGIFTNSKTSLNTWEQWLISIIMGIFIWSVFKAFSDHSS